MIKLTSLANVQILLRTAQSPEDRDLIIEGPTPEEDVEGSGLPGIVILVLQVRGSNAPSRKLDRPM